jgi:hypothetical protein
VDVSGDAKLDLVTVNAFDQSVSVLLGTGDGTFAAKVDYPTGLYPESVAVGDVNADGRLDLVVANSGSGTVSVLLGKGHRD